MKEAHMRRTTTLVAALLLTLLSLTACSNDSSSGAGSGGGTGTTLDITIKNGKVTPHGDRVKAEVGQPITLNIDADTAGEIHVHSSPEQEIKFEKGTSTKKLTIDQPGIVDVEDHALEQVIVQLQVS
jgi:predicted small secreted protein